MLLFLFVTSFAVDAEPFILIGSENRIGGDGAVPRAKAIIDVGVADHFSITTTFVVSPGYAEAYIGPTWSPTKSFSLGVAGGMETADAPWRSMAYASLHANNLSLFWLAEYGGSGLWYKSTAMYDVGSLSVGAIVQRFDGVGPRAVVPYRDVEFWAAVPLYDVETGEFGGLVGLNWTP